jgi:hypothetical protein
MKTKTTKKPAAKPAKSAATLRDLPTRKNPVGGRKQEQSDK